MDRAIPSTDVNRSPSNTSCGEETLNTSVFSETGSSTKRQHDQNELSVNMTRNGSIPAAQKASCALPSTSMVYNPTHKYVSSTQRIARDLFIQRREARNVEANKKLVETTQMLGAVRFLSDAKPKNSHRQAVIPERNPCVLQPVLPSLDSYSGCNTTSAPTNQERRYPKHRRLMERCNKPTSDPQKTAHGGSGKETRTETARMLAALNLILDAKSKRAGQVGDSTKSTSRLKHTRPAMQTRDRSKTEEEAVKKIVASLEEALAAKPEPYYDEQEEKDTVEQYLRAYMSSGLDDESCMESLILLARIDHDEETFWSGESKADLDDSVSHENGSEAPIGNQENCQILNVADKYDIDDNEDSPGWLGRRGSEEHSINEMVPLSSFSDAHKHGSVGYEKEDSTLAVADEENSSAIVSVFQEKGSDEANQEVGSPIQSNCSDCTNMDSRSELLAINGPEPIHKDRVGSPKHCNLPYSTSAFRSVNLVSDQDDCSLGRRSLSPASFFSEEGPEQATINMDGPSRCSKPRRGAPNKDVVRGDVEGFSVSIPSVLSDLSDNKADPFENPLIAGCLDFIDPPSDDDSASDVKSKESAKVRYCMLRNESKKKINRRLNPKGASPFGSTTLEDLMGYFASFSTNKYNDHAYNDDGKEEDQSVHADCLGGSPTIQNGRKLDRAEPNAKDYKMEDVDDALELAMSIERARPTKDHGSSLLDSVRTNFPRMYERLRDRIDQQEETIRHTRHDEPEQSVAQGADANDSHGELSFLVGFVDKITEIGEITAELKSTLFDDDSDPARQVNDRISVPEKEDRTEPIARDKSEHLSDASKVSLKTRNNKSQPMTAIGSPRGNKAEGLSAAAILAAGRSAVFNASQESGPLPMPHATLQKTSLTMDSGLEYCDHPRADSDRPRNASGRMRSMPTERMGNIDGVAASPSADCPSSAHFRARRQTPLGLAAVTTTGRRVAFNLKSSSRTAATGPAVRARRPAPTRAVVPRSPGNCSGDSVAEKRGGPANMESSIVEEGRSPSSDLAERSRPDEAPWDEQTNTLVSPANRQSQREPLDDEGDRFGNNAAFSKLLPGPSFLAPSRFQSSPGTIPPNYSTKTTTRYDLHSAKLDTTSSFQVM